MLTLHCQTCTEKMLNLMKCKDNFRTRMMNFKMKRQYYREKLKVKQTLDFPVHSTPPPPHPTKSPLLHSNNAYSNCKKTHLVLGYLFNTFCTKLLYIILLVPHNIQREIKNT